MKLTTGRHEQMTNGTSLLNVIDTLYGCILDETSLPNSMLAVAQQMRCEHGTVFRWNTNCIGDPQHVAVYASDTARFANFVDDYCNHFIQHDPTRLIAGRFPQGWFIDSRNLSAAERQRDPMLNGCIRPHRFAGWAALEIKSGRRMWALSFLRSSGVKDFSADQIATVDQLSPHIARALAIREKLEGVEAQLMAGHAALDLLCFPLWIVDGERNVAFMNCSADASCTTALDPLSVRNGKLHASDRRAQDWLSQAIRNATRAVTRIADARQMPSKDGVPYPIRVVPLPPRLGESRFGTIPLAVVVATAHAVPSIGDLVVCLYGLTAAEARVASAMLAGKTLNEMTVEFDVRESTIQSQIKAILAKTGTKRQTQLIALLNRLAIIS
jgi:DNA-binding CsgD family transcriptional regulator